MSRSLLGNWLLSGIMAGCVQVASHAEEPARLKAGDAASRNALQAGLQRALGRPVTLASDALVNDTQLIIEPVPARAGGQRIDGRELTSRAERFTLWQVEGRCMLRRENTGERFELSGASCLPVSAKEK